MIIHSLTNWHTFIKNLPVIKYIVYFCITFIYLNDFKFDKQSVNKNLTGMSKFQVLHNKST